MNQQMRIEFAQSCRQRELLTDRQYDVWYRHEVCGVTFHEMQIPALRDESRTVSARNCCKLFNQAKLIMDCEYRHLYPERGGILSDPAPIGVTVSFGSRAETREDVTAEAADWKVRLSAFRKER